MSSSSPSPLFSNDARASIESAQPEYNAAPAEQSRASSRDDREAATLELAHRAITPYIAKVRIIERGTARELEIARLGWGPFETPHGEYYHLPLSVNDRWHEYHAFVKASLWDADLFPIFQKAENLLVRLDSGCVSGMIFGAKDCDCRSQLEKAREEISRAGEGIVVHISRQDGRGMGTAFKTGTQILQKELQWDTVKAAQKLACSRTVDMRTFTGAVAILKFLLRNHSSASLVLASGSPTKEASLLENGFRVTMRPPDVPVTPQTAHHLKAKALHWSHSIPGITKT